MARGGEVTLLSKEAADVGGRPCGDSTTKEVGILSQNRTAEPLPRFGFEVAVEILTNDRFERCHRFQRRESFCSIATALDDQGGQVLFCFCICRFWNEEGNYRRRELRGWNELADRERRESEYWLPVPGLYVPGRLLRVPLLFAAGLAYLLVLFHQLIFRCAPGGDHSIQIFLSSAHGFDFCLAAPLLLSKVEAERLTMTSDSKRFAAFELTRKVSAKLTDANLFGFHSAYSVCSISYLAVGLKIGSIL